MAAGCKESYRLLGWQFMQKHTPNDEWPQHICSYLCYKPSIIGGKLLAALPTDIQRTSYTKYALARDLIAWIVIVLPQL